LLSATLHFAVTNYGVWAFGNSYPHSMAGLVDCYVRGLPLFRNTLISMAVFLPLLFSPIALTRLTPVTAHRLGAVHS